MTTAITEQTINGPYEAVSTSPRLETLTWTAADTAGNTIVMSTGRCLLLFRNSGAGDHTVAVTSSADPYNRKGDIAAVTVGAGAIIAKIFESPGWEQTLGGRNLLVTCNHVEMLIAAIAL